MQTLASGTLKYSNGRANGALPNGITKLTNGTSNSYANGSATGKTNGFTNGHANGVANGYANGNISNSEVPREETNGHVPKAPDSPTFNTRARRLVCMNVDSTLD